MLEARSDTVTAVVSQAKPWSADRYLIAAGSSSEGLLRRVGVRVPVRPAKGYSVTFEGLEHYPALGIPVIDDERHAAVVPLQGAVPLAGMAEFADFDRTIDPTRISNLVGLLKTLVPEAQYLHRSNPRPIAPRDFLEGLRTAVPTFARQQDSPSLR